MPTVETSHNRQSSKVDHACENKEWADKGFTLNLFQTIEGSVEMECEDCGESIKVFTNSIVKPL